MVGGPGAWPSHQAAACWPQLPTGRARSAKACDAAHGTTAPAALRRLESPQDLQQVLDLVEPGDWGPRVFFLLVRHFESKGLITEALHCYNQAQAANVKLSPAMEAAAGRLRARMSGNAAKGRAG